MRLILTSRKSPPALAIACVMLFVTAFFHITSVKAGNQSDNAAPPLPETGIWYDDTKQGAVEITQCGKKLCGHIVWLENPLTEDGTPIIDKYNSDPSKAKRPVCGLQVLGELTIQEDGTYDNGWVYDPKVGHTFNVAINLVDPNKLHVRGYAKLKIFGRSLTWTRAPNNLERCTN